MSKQLHRSAIIKAGEIRNQLGVDMFQPINIFDFCIKLGIDVKFVDVNMEGFYAKQNGVATILLSSFRPLPRRVFTCGHELGHHVFNHGLKVDILSEHKGGNGFKEPDEILVDSFSAALLMPVGGIQVEFLNRNLDIKRATPLEFYTVASAFGVGYSTLISQCRINGMINELQSIGLLKLTPAKIFETYFGKTEQKSYFKIIDGLSEPSAVDIEYGNFIIFPSKIDSEKEYLQEIVSSRFGFVYRAKKAGITSLTLPNGNTFFLRIQRENYIGFADYRHFEN